MSNACAVPTNVIENVENITSHIDIKHTDEYTHNKNRNNQDCNDNEKDPLENVRLLDNVTKEEITSEENTEKVYELWEVLEQFGKYQKMQYFYVCLATVFVVTTSLNYIFVAGDVDYRCSVPKCEATPRRFHTDWWPNTTVDRCSRPILSNPEICSEGFTGFVEPCDEWVYESNNTIVGELNVACQPMKAKLVGTIHNIGMLLSMLMSGYVSDKFGRKPAFIFFAVGSSVGHLKVFATSYYMYAATELVESMLSGGTYTAGTVLRCLLGIICFSVIENGGRQNRILSGIIYAYSTYIGETLYAIIAMWVRYWKTIIRIIYTPIIICLPFLFLVRESPRWQFLNGRADEAIATIEYSAKMNKLKINKENYHDNEILKAKLNIKNVEERESFKTVITSKEVLLRLLVSFVCRFTGNFVYFGLLINSAWLHGDKYTNFLLLSLMSYPGELVALYFMNKIGRKLPLIVGFIACGVLCALSGLIPKDYAWLGITAFLIGKIFIAACFTGALTYSMELFPTNARGILLSICSVAGRTGAMMAPLTPMLLNISPALPAALFAGSTIISGLLLTLTPETKDLPLMDTVEQVEASVRTRDLTPENIKA